MKSVVVQAGTVAKAIEIAWLKADKPEEFFIRVLQEHTSGFLGFGAQKAKIAFFFKNSNKSDSLFPTVLKQKEYINFFGNKNLKNPTEIDIVDLVLNKNAIIGSGEHKKKPHHNNQQKNQSVKPPVQTHQVQNKSAVDVVAKPVHLNKIATHNNVQAQQVKQVKVNQPVQEKLQHKQSEKQDERKSTLQVSLQAPTKSLEPKKVVTQITHTKENVVSDIAKVLKKVQSQKIVANVSRPSSFAKAPADKSVGVVQSVHASSDQANQDSLHKKRIERPKIVTPKFESYAEFMDAQVDKAIAKSQSTVDVIEKIEKEIIAQVNFVEIKPVETSVADEAIVAKPVTEKRPFVTMKRRPLTTENPGVSGITRSVDKKSSDTK